MANRIMLTVAASALTMVSQAATYTVDDDRAQRPNADFTSIQAAVNAAAPGDRILVYPGMYNEHVDITKTLTVLGVRGHDNHDDNDDADHCNGNPHREAVITPPAGGGVIGTVFIGANNVRFDGFTVTGNADGPGIYTSATFSGYMIARNLVRDNVFGLYLNSSGAIQSSVESNCFVKNVRPGAASGNGIYSDQGLGTARIAGNGFTGHTNTSIITAGPANGLNITRNRIVDDATILLFGATNSEITQNESIRSNSHGIMLASVNGVSVHDNDLRDGAWSGIAVFGTDLGATSSSVIVDDNEIRNFGDDGVSVRDGVMNSWVRRNKIDKVGRDGIRMTVGTSNNLIERNRMKKSGEHDAHDDSVGTKTAGTANTWKKNEGKTQNRPGLLN